MFEAVRNIERVETLGRADSEVTVATVETFLSDVHGITDITGHPEEGHTNNNNKNTEDLLNKGVLYHFFYRHIGTIILIFVCLLCGGGLVLLAVGYLVPVVECRQRRIFL